MESSGSVSLEIKLHEVIRELTRRTKEKMMGLMRIMV